LGNRLIEFRPHAAQSGPSVWTWIIPVLAGTAAYFVFAQKLELWETPISWWEELLELAPALMLVLMFQVFVLWPLRILFTRGQMNSPFLFLTISILIWIAASAMILHGTNALQQGDLWVDASVIVPGIVVALVYTLMNVSFRPR
jgi:hypothetical protein